MTAEQLWHKFCSEMKIDEATPYEAWAFGGDAATTDELLELVLQGRKFGTASAYDEYVPENEASRRTILANGGKYMETVYLEEDNVNLERYSIKL